MTAMAGPGRGGHRVGRHSAAAAGSQNPHNLIVGHLEPYLVHEDLLAVFRSKCSGSFPRR